MSDVTDSTTESLMHCTLSLTVCKCTPCQRASFKNTTGSFSWGHDPYTLACKARPSSDRCWTSLSVSLSFIVIVIVDVPVRQNLKGGVGVLRLVPCAHF